MKEYLARSPMCGCGCETQLGRDVETIPYHYPTGSHHVVIGITAERVHLAQTVDQRCRMPILFMALIALAVFVGMGLMLFYATYCEVKQAHTPPPPAKQSSTVLKTHAPLA